MDCQTEDVSRLKSILNDYREVSLQTSLSNEYLDSEDMIYITCEGTFFRKTKINGNDIHWTILANINDACGWYNTKSPFVCSDIDNTPKVNINGRFVESSPCKPFTIYPIDSFKYFLCEGKGGNKECIYIYLMDKDGGLVGYSHPLSNTYSSPVSIPDIHAWGQLLFRDTSLWNGMDDSSYPCSKAVLSYISPLRELPVFNPTSYKSIPKKSDILESLHGTFDWQEIDNINEQVDSSSDSQSNHSYASMSSSSLSSVRSFDYNCNTGNKELRQDVFSGEWYLKEEFSNYYGNTILWDMLSPLKNSQRFMLESIIIRNKDILTENNINHIIDRIIETFM